MRNPLLMFGFGMKPMIDSFKDDIVDSQFAKYQYILKTQYYVFRVIFYAMMQSYTGWIAYCVPAKVFFEIILIGAVAYLIVSRILLRRIHRIPMTDALKMNE